jgi:Transposase and inactivated derivatives
MKAHRAVLMPLPPECDVRYIRRLMALTNLAYRGYTVTAPDMLRYVQHQLFSWREFKRSLVFGATPKRWLAGTWIPLKTYRIFPDGRRIGDPNAPVVLDFMRNVIRVRQVCRNQPRYSVELPMSRWVLERMIEGGDIKFAKVGVRRGKLYLALVAERKVQPIQPSGYALVIDVNSWKHGVAWALIKGDRIVKWTRERPDLGYIERMYSELVGLERKYGILKRLGLHETLEGRKLWLKIKHKRRKLHKYLRDFAQRLTSRLAKKAMKRRTRVVIDDMLDESRRELLEERISSGLAKVYFSSVRHFVELFVNQLRWYGVPYEFKRLYSTICPRCGAKMKELPSRIMKCENCNFSVHRDFVPVLWFLQGSR